jgi:Zn-dependent protease/predicted transcriptional regulator
MSRGFRIARIAGIELHIDWSLLVIFFIITFSLSAGVFPQWHPDWSMSLAWAVGLAAALLFLCSILVHELSHALVGRMHGIEVRRITLFLFGGAAQMENEPLDWHGELQTAIIGPVVSLIIGALCIALTGFVINPLEFDPDHVKESLAALGVLATLLLWLGQINLVLAIFNMVPAFPLDGGRVLRAILWGITHDLRRATRWASALGQAFAWFLIAAGFAMILGLHIPVFGTGIVGGLWLCLIGWFLNNAALVSYWQLVVRESLRDVPVTRLMQTRFQDIPPNLAIDRLVDDYLLHSDQTDFPVMTNGSLVGTVSQQQVRKLARNAWHTTTVGDIMSPVNANMKVSPRDDVQKAMALLASGNASYVPVIDNDKVYGLIRRADILKWFSLYENIDVHPAVMLGRSK